MEGLSLAGTTNGQDAHATRANILTTWATTLIRRPRKSLTNGKPSRRNEECLIMKQIDACVDTFGKTTRVADTKQVAKGVVRTALVDAL